MVKAMKAQGRSELWEKQRKCRQGNGVQSKMVTHLVGPGKRRGGIKLEG